MILSVVYLLCDGDFACCLQGAHDVRQTTIQFTGNNGVSVDVYII